MVGSSPHQQEPMGSQRQDDFLNLERKQDQEGSMHTTHTSKSHSRVGSHVSQEQNNRAMQSRVVIGSVRSVFFIWSTETEIFDL